MTLSTENLVLPICLGTVSNCFDSFFRKIEYATQRFVANSRNTSIRSVFILNRKRKENIFSEAKLNMSAHFEIRTSNLKKHLWKINKTLKENSLIGSAISDNEFA